jgi:3-oxoacyl-[acyl-carrier protein] reductase
VNACAAHFGHLEIVVANAGGPQAGGIESFGPEDWQRATALVFTSSVELATAAVPHMRRAAWGRILFVTSITARQPVDNLLLSNALRPAVLGFAHSLARELANEGITVNAILPGYTRTERMAELGVGAETVAEIPAGRLGEPREFAAAAAFLVSERASYITGAAVPVDGGWLRGMF